jgi:hypothetical protein
MIGTGYRSYLVRFWQSTDKGTWRASAQCVQTGSTLLFGNVAGLLTFLQAEILGWPVDDAADGHPKQAQTI